VLLDSHTANVESGGMVHSLAAEWPDICSTDDFDAAILAFADAPVLGRPKRNW
jgi:hypothetical protein